MPELPEVETIKNGLAPRVVGRRILRANLPWPGQVRRPSPDEFRRDIAGQIVEGVRRRGKYLIVDLSGPLTLVVHLKMTGCLLVRPWEAEPLPHTRAILCLDNSTSIHFLDQRKFGGMWLVENESQVVGRLGIEPLDHAFGAEALRELLRKHDVPIKPLLCNQMVIAGIGNMYADEALFEARIHPEKKSRQLKPGEAARLHQAICHVLAEGIARCGASVNTYQQPDGEPGFAHLFFRVAHRRGEQCYRCGTPICRISLRGRGTYFCPRCQQA